jgi:hypothetical protein
MARVPMLAVAVVAGAGVAFAAPAAWASLQDDATATSQFTADVLQPPSGLSGKASCGTLGYQLDLTWTASPTTWIDGYDVALATTPGGPYEIAPIEGGQDPMATSRTVGGLQPATDYYVVVQSTKGGWYARSSEIDVRTRPRCK